MAISQDSIKYFLPDRRHVNDVPFLSDELLLSLRSYNFSKIGDFSENCTLQRTYLSYVGESQNNLCIHLKLFAIVLLMNFKPFVQNLHHFCEQNQFLQAGGCCFTYRLNKSCYPDLTQLIKASHFQAYLMSLTMESGSPQYHFIRRSKTPQLI